MSGDPDAADALTRVLRERARDTDGSLVTVESVRRSAHRMRWRLRVAGGAALGVALAVAVPAGVAITHDVADGRRGVHLTLPAPTPDDVTPRPDGSYLLSMSGLRQGLDPALVYLRGRTLNLPGGVIVDLPAAYSEVVDDGAGWLVRGDGTQAAFLDAGGRVLRSGSMEPGFAVSRDGSRVGAVRVDPSGDETLLSLPVAGGRLETWSAGLGAGVRAVGYLDDDRLVWQSGGDHPHVGVASAQGLSYLSGLLSVRGTSEADGLVSGIVSGSSHGWCSGVMRPAAGSELLWTTCYYTLGKFSPDGRHVLGTDAAGGDRGSSTLAVMDAHTGEVQVSYAQGHHPQVMLTDVAWEGDDHLLAVAHEGDTWKILRLDLHGHLEQAADPAVAGPDDPAPFHLATQP